jgi:hypothetical protein
MTPSIVLMLAILCWDRSAKSPQPRPRISGPQPAIRLLFHLRCSPGLASLSLSTCSFG